VLRNGFSIFVRIAESERRVEGPGTNRCSGRCRVRYRLPDLVKLGTGCLDDKTMIDRQARNEHQQGQVARRATPSRMPRKEVDCALCLAQVPGRVELRVPASRRPIGAVTSDGWCRKQSGATPTIDLTCACPDRVPLCPISEIDIHNRGCGTDSTNAGHG